MIRNFYRTISEIYTKVAVFAVLFLYGSIAVIYGQNRKEQPPPLRERMFFGGSLGLQFGTFTDIHIAPIVGLWVRPRIAIAAGPNFTYYKGPDFNGLDNETTLYGGNVYTEFVLVKDINNALPIGLHMGIFLHLEDELLSLESAYWDPMNSSNRFAVNTLLGGFGISQQLGARSSLNLMFLWTLTNSGYALYNNPEIRISFNF